MERKRWKSYSELTIQQRKKHTARSSTGRAVRAGRIEKQSCRRCGCKSAQAHHSDYNNIYMVIWLCRKCHGNLHKVFEQYHAILPKFKSHLELSFLMGEKLI